MMDDNAGDLRAHMHEMGQAARAAARSLAVAPPEVKRAALLAAADALTADVPGILAANAEDVRSATQKCLASAMIDRLTLTPSRVADMAAGVRAIAEQPDPVGRVLETWRRPNGLAIERVSTPLGVIGVIYESRPNVTADAAALCLKSGNAAILRGGSESARSNRAIHAAMVSGVAEAGLPATSIQRVGVQDRAAVGVMLEDMAAFIDVIIPRGGRSLVSRVQSTARVPVFAHLEGICHLYLDKSADPTKAAAVVVNAKMRRTGICGAAECLLIDRGVDASTAQAALSALAAAGCEIRGDAEVCALEPRATAAAPEDYGREFLDNVIAARVVDGVDGAIAHIEAHGSQHTDAVLTEDDAVWATFRTRIDSAIVVRNASTQFADGGEFGMGAEIGIATGKMHARGPVGAQQLTTFKYLVSGDYALRP